MLNVDNYVAKTRDFEQVLSFPLSLSLFRNDNSIIACDRVLCSFGLSEHSGLRNSTTR